MKSFFKKLSLVLAAAMVVTMVPAQAKAAETTTIGLLADYPSYKTGYTMEVGETATWSFNAKQVGYGATTKAEASKTIKWATSNANVVALKNASGIAQNELTAKAAGSATIAFSITCAGKDWTASNTVTVKGAATTTDSKVAPYAFDTFTITYATEEEAAAAVKAGITVKRVKVTAKGDYLLSVKPSFTTDKNVVYVTGLTNNVTYDVTAAGIAEHTRVTVAAGDPVMVVLSYADIVIGSGNNILGEKITKTTGSPKVTLLDENGIICKYDSKNAKFSGTKVGKASFSATNGNVTFKNMTDSVDMHVAYEYTYADGTKKTFEDTCSVFPTEYVAPNLYGFVEQITLSDGTKTGKDFVWPTTFNYSETMSVGEEATIVYYFEGSDGIRYAGYDEKDLVSFGKVTDANKMLTLGNADYKFQFAKDDASVNIVSLTNKGKVRALQEGTQTILLYQKDATSGNYDILVGSIDITVSPKAKISDLNLSTTTVEGYNNSKITSQNTVKITYEIEDQYGDGIKGEPAVYNKDKKVLDSSVVVAPKSGSNNKGEIIFDLTQFAVVEDAEYTVKCGTVEEVVYVTVDKINTGSTDVAYGLEVEDGVISTSALEDPSTTDVIAPTIKVYKMIDDIPYEYVDFSVTSLENFDDTTAKAANELWVVIYDADEAPVSKHGDSTIPTTGIDKLSASSQFDNGAYVFDTLNTTEAATETIKDVATVGTFTVTLYLSDGNKTFSDEDEKTFEVRFTAEGVKGFDTTYALKADKSGLDSANKTYQWTDTTTTRDFSYVVSDTDAKVKWAADLGLDLKADSVTHNVTVNEKLAWDLLVYEIISEFVGWYDEDGNGKNEKEWNKLSDMAGAQFTNVEYIIGADRQSVFIQSFDFSRDVDTYYFNTQTLNVNKVFAVGGVSEIKY